MTQDGLVPQLRLMYQALWSSAVRNRLFALGGGIWIVVIATAYGQIERTDQLQLDHLRLRLVYPRGADSGGSADLF